MSMNHCWQYILLTWQIHFCPLPSVSMIIGSLSLLWRQYIGWPTPLHSTSFQLGHLRPVWSGLVLVHPPSRLALPCPGWPCSWNNTTLWLAVDAGLLDLDTPGDGWLVGMLMTTELTGPFSGGRWRRTSDLSPWRCSARPMFVNTNTHLK